MSSASAIASAAPELSWDRLDRMASVHGDSFYTLDAGAFSSNCKEFLEAFCSIYPRSNIAYSYKTNYTPALCRIVDDLGGYAEVVSGLEYELAVRVGVAAHRIIFNGPYKPQRELERALLEGAIVNLDGMHEVMQVEAIARRAPDRQLTVGLRCNLNVGTPDISRFGFDVEGPELQMAAAALRQLGNCRLAGLQCHISTSHKSVESYADRTRKMLQVAADIFADTPPSFIDVGGGFFGRMQPELKAQFPVPIPGYRDYAAGVATELAAIYPNGAGPELILEPGTALCGDVMKFVAKVVSSKTVRSRTVVLCSGSVYDIKPTLHQKNLPMRVYSPVQPPGVGHRRPVDIVGYTCMEHDILYRGYERDVNPGDYLVFENVGAYALVLAPPFIRPTPAVIAYDSGVVDGSEVIKREATFEDVFAPFSGGHAGA